MATALYNCEIGKEIKITDSGGTAVFFVADHYTKGREYHTVVLRKDSISTSRMSSNIYLSCTDMQNYLNNDYYNSIEEVVRKYIANSDIQCADSSGNIKMIQGYIYPPSARQLDGSTYGTNMDCYPEGTPFDFFKRYSVGDYAPWSTIATRSTMKSDDRIILRTQRGFGSTFYRNVSYVNPTFSIKKGLYINSDGTLFAPKPSVPSGVKYTGEPFFESKSIEISWNASSIEDNTPIKYEVSVKENSGSWNILRTTSSLSCVATLPASDGSKTVTYRVRAQSSNGDEYSDYATGPVITVLHNSAPSVPNGITFSTPKAGTPITVSTEGSTDIDNDPIVYEFERQIDSSEWTSVEMTFNKSTTDTVPSSGEYINYRVRARDNYGNRSAYTTGVKQLISYLPGVTNPGKPMYKYPISGLDMDITWGAAASEDASIVTYAVEVKIDDGEWIDRGQTSQTEFKFYIPRLDEEGHTIQVRIKAKIPNGSESEYSTGKVTEILYHKVRRLIPWNFGTDFRIRQFTKNSRSQYQTMLSGSTAEIVATGNLRLGDMPLETLIRVNEDGSPALFILAKHDYESELNGNGRDLLVRKDCYGTNQWNSNNINTYDNSQIDISLNNNYKNKLNLEMQNMIGITKFRYTPGNGNNTISVLDKSIFLLSATELGKNETWFQVEGTALPISSILSIAYLDGQPTMQWTRSPSNELSVNAIVLWPDGEHASQANCINKYGLRPCFTLSADTLLNPNPNPDGSYNIVWE